MTLADFAGRTDSAEWPINLPLDTFPAELDISMPIEGSKLVEYAELIGEAYPSFSKRSARKSDGHYLATAAIATIMAGHSYFEPHLRVLDLGSGTGILSAAVCEAACGGGASKSPRGRPRTGGSRSPGALL